VGGRVDPPSLTLAELPLVQSTVSKHLRILRKASLIQGEIEPPPPVSSAARAVVNLSIAPDQFAFGPG
jgi:hypothetical protein